MQDLNIHGIEHIIARPDLDYIRQNTERIPEFYGHFLECVLEMKDVPGAKSLVDRFLSELRSGRGAMNRGFVHLHLACCMKKSGLLQSVEQGIPPADFSLTNGLKVELTRVADQESLIVAGLKRSLARERGSMSGLSLTLRMKSYDVGRILSQFDDDLSRGFAANAVTENDLYHLSVTVHTDDVALTVSPNTNRSACISVMGDHSLCVDFIGNEPILLDMVHEKLLKDAAAQSRVLIVDFTNSVVVRDLNDVQGQFDRLKKGLDLKGVDMIVGVIFSLTDKTFVKQRWYILRENKSTDIAEFEKAFLL